MRQVLSRVCRLKRQISYVVPNYRPGRKELGSRSSWCIKETAAVDEADSRVNTYPNRLLEVFVAALLLYSC